MIGQRLFGPAMQPHVHPLLSLPLTEVKHRLTNLVCSPTFSEITWSRILIRTWEFAEYPIVVLLVLRSYQTLVSTSSHGQESIRGGVRIDGSEQENIAQYCTSINRTSADGPVGIT